MAKTTLQVQNTLCATCIYKPSSGFDIKELEAEVADRYGSFRTYRACHHAIGKKVCCRGFWNKHKDDFSLGQIAQRLNLIEFVDVDTEEE